MIVEKKGWRGAKDLAGKLKLLSTLIPDDENARTHDARNVAEVRASLEEEGQVEPLIVQLSSMRVIHGNARLVAMRDLEWTKAAVTMLDVDDEAARRLAIRLNRTGELGGWNEDVLLEWASDNSRESLAKLGWKDAELDKLLAPAIPPEKFPEFDKDIETPHRCPKCGYEWS